MTLRCASPFIAFLNASQHAGMLERAVPLKKGMHKSCVVSVDAKPHVCNSRVRPRKHDSSETLRLDVVALRQCTAKSDELSRNWRFQAIRESF